MKYFIQTLSALFILSAHLVLLSPSAFAAEAESTPAGKENSPSEKTVTLPPKAMEVTGRYGLALVRDAAPDISDDTVAATVLETRRQWNLPHCQVAWYTVAQKPGQGIFVLGETTDGKTVSIIRPKTAEEAIWLEKGLCYPTTPGELAREYLNNEVTADEDFRGKMVIFKSVVSEIARGAFNKPYVFFPSEEGSFTGLTCYFPNKDPSLRKIKKGSAVTVRGTVKGFLMQDVILERCDILTVHTP